MTKEVDWCLNNESLIGPNDEISGFYNACALAVSYGGSVKEEEVETIAKIAYQVQLDAVVWLYTEEYCDPREFGLPSLSDAAGMLEQTCGWAPEYDTPSSNEFAEWVLSKHSDQVARDFYEDSRLEEMLREKKRREERQAT